jgi:hypothetical protein
MLEREVGCIPGVGQILIRPLHLLVGRRRIGVGGLNALFTAPLAAGSHCVARWHLLPTGLGRSGIARLA